MCCDAHDACDACDIIRLATSNRTLVSPLTERQAAIRSILRLLAAYGAQSAELSRAALWSLRSLCMRPAASCGDEEIREAAEGMATLREFGGASAVRIALDVHGATLSQVARSSCDELLKLLE